MGLPLDEYQQAVLSAHDHACANDELASRLIRSEDGRELLTLCLKHHVPPEVIARDFLRAAHELRQIPPASSPRGRG